ncbi:MAG: trypsin-like peptidase domain-containing protein [Deltaproteobacteria bacterium]|jgi:S1-C subfamily serine protease
MKFIGKGPLTAVIAAMLVFLGSLGLGSARAQENLPALIKKVLPAVVTVVGFNNRGKVTRLGSGFFIDPQGHLITNLHVIKGAARAVVKLPKGQVYPLTEMVAVDEKADLVKLAVHLPGGSPHYLTMSPARPEVGEHVVVLGSPLGLEHTVTEGMVSAIRTVRNRGEFLQISAPISPGSSGGPVVNMKGQVIGIAAFQVKGQNINFAVPGYRVLALRDGPPRALPGHKATGKSLPARPGVNVPRPQMQVD